MAKPSNSIAKIKMPGENTQRPIVPYGLTDGTYYATVPGMNDDGVIIISKPNDTQEIYNYPLALYKYLNIYSDNIDNLDNPYDWVDPDISIYSTKIRLTDNDSGEYYDYYFPDRSGALVVREDDTYYDEDLDEDVYSEKTLLATTERFHDNEDGIYNYLYAIPDGFEYKWLGAFPHLRNSAKFVFPQTASQVQTNILGLQVDIVDLKSL